MIGSAIRVAACASCLVALAVASPHTTYVSSPKVLIVKGPRFEFYAPYAVAGAGGSIWVLNSDGVLTVVRASDGTLRRTLSGSKYHLGAYSFGVGVTRQDVWLVGGPQSNELIELNGTTGKVLRSVSAPRALVQNAGALDVVGNDLWAENTRAVFEIDLSTGHVLRQISGPRPVWGLVASSSKVWVLSRGNFLECFSTTHGRLLATIPLSASLGNSPHTVSMALVGDHLWVPDVSRVYVIQANTMRVSTVLSSKKYRFNSTFFLASNGRTVWSVNLGVTCPECSLVLPTVSVISATNDSLESVLTGRPFQQQAQSILWYDGRVWLANAIGPDGSGPGSLTAFG